MKTNERFAWAAEVMALKPTTDVLEIGCGAGLLIQEILRYLESGTITAIDKSKPLIDLAAKRNAEAIKQRRVKILNLDFREAKFKKAGFDIIAAFNVNFFWKETGTELAMIRSILRPGGSLFIFYQAPFQISLKAVDPLKKVLENHSFEIVDTHFKEMQPASALAVHSIPK